MNQKPALCCPTPAVKNGLHPHPISESNKIPTTPGYACENPLFVQVCDAVTPPADVTLIGKDCADADVAVTGKPGQLTAVTQAPGTVFNVKLCKDPKDIEKVVLCDQATGHKVAVISDLSDPTAPVVTLWDLNTGAAFAGDISTLEACPDTDTESYPVEMCDSGVQFIRWIVKANGEPTGLKFDTDPVGAPYTVTDETAVTIGKCDASAVPQSVSSATADDLSALQEGTSFALYKSECCSLKLTTSIGTIIIPKTATSYSTQVFKTPFTIDSVEVVDGTCDLATVTIISNLS